MRPRRSIIVMLLMVGLTAGFTHRSAAPLQKPPQYKVFAVRYATLVDFPLGELVPGADSAARIDATMMVWLLQGPGKRTVLVDAGFYRDGVSEDYKVGDFQRPSDALDSMGVPAASVTDIIVSHVHWDHLDGVDLFPHATIWIQRAEWEYYVGPKGEALHGDISAVDAAMLVKLQAEGRVRLVEGDDQEIIPGIRVYTGGRHTYASQYAGVQTRSGTVIIASDNVYLYENIDRHLPIGTTFDAKSNLAAQDRMMGLASARKFVIPGHDPAVFERFPLVRPGVVRID